MTHIVKTEQIQQLIENSLKLVQELDGADWPGNVTMDVPDVLRKARADLRRASEKLFAEELSCDGWPQT